MKEDMNIGKARAIFINIESDKYNIEEKKEAIRKVIDMETHNSITKDNMLNVIDWLWTEHYSDVSLKRAGKRNSQSAAAPVAQPLRKTEKPVLMIGGAFK